MSTVINTNVTAINSHRSMKIVGESTQKASEKLSSGLRINRAGDDAAGLAISEKMRSQIRGLDQASRNSQDGISLIQTAEGALQETEDMLQRMRELVVQASNDSNEQSDRDKIALELDELSKEINATAEKTEFNKKKLIDKSWENSQLYFQVGANEGQSIKFNIAGMDATSLGVDINDIGNVVRGDVPDTGAVKVGLDGTVTTALTKHVVVPNSGEVGFGGDASALTFDGYGNVTIKADVFTALVNAAGDSSFFGIKGETDANGDFVDKTVSVSELAGKVFVDDVNGNIYKFSDDGKTYNVSTEDISTMMNSKAGGVSLDLTDTTGADNATMKTHFGKDNESYDLDDGTKISFTFREGVAPTVSFSGGSGEIYTLEGEKVDLTDIANLEGNILTKDGTILNFDAGTISIIEAGNVAFGSPQRVASENQIDTTNIAGNYISSSGTFSINNEGVITVNSDLKDVNGDVVVTIINPGVVESYGAGEIAEGTEILTDKGLVTFTKDGLKLDTTITTKTAALTNIYDAGDGSSIEIKGGKVVDVLGALTDSNGVEINTLEDAYGKSFTLSDGRVLNVRDDGFATFEDVVKPTVRNEVAEKANSEYYAKLNSLGANPSLGEVISGLAIKIDAAIEIVSSQRAQLGAYQNRLEHTIKNLDTSSENLSAAESRIRDTDMAKEMMNFTKSNVLSQAAMSMLAQANQAPNNVLSLLR